MTAEVIARITAFLLDEGSPGYPHEGPPPGSPPTQKFEGPWFSTQLILSLGIGVSSFLTFCFLRTRWDVVYMGRTKLKDFSPTPAHSPDVQAHGGRLFSWIIPTLRTSEYTVLQTVGLDAAVLLNFYRMAFLLFSTLALLATVILMPLNYFRHGSTDSDVPDTTPGNDTDILAYDMFSHKHRADIPSNHTSPPTMYDILLDPQTSAAVNLIFAYVFTALVLTFLHKNFHRFVQSRQTFALHLIHSISTRTVLVTNLPTHLRGDRALANYFEGCGWTVESVSVVREVEPLRRKLEKRTNALLRLENAWVDWVGNPAKGVKGYDPNIYNEQRGKGKNISQATDLTESPSGGNDDTPLIPDLDEPSASSSRAESRSQTPGTGRSGRSDTPGWGDLLDAPDSGFNGASEQNGEEPQVKVQTSRPRPQYRPRWFGNKVDAIEFWEKKFRAADAEVREMRRNAQFDSTHVAFVTFEDVKEAQMACQVVHYPKHSEVVTELAPEPRDIVWSNISISARQGRLRTIAARIVYLLLLLFWIPPVSTLATLLSYEEIKRILPWLARIIERSPRLNSIITNSFTSLALIVFNGILPFFLSWLSYEQGYKSRSGTEYSLMRKYHLALLISVLFIFLLTTTIWAVIRDLADTPAKVPEKLASALLKSNAKNFMVSYVMLQGLGLMPLQLLNLGPLFTLGWARSLYTSTPRDFAEAYAPPMLNYGWVYPQALLVFTITLVFSVVSPFILPFGALYFGVAYLVYKYKLLFIYFKPYESNGEAWRITFTRLLWAVVIFQLFMTGLFTLRKLFWPSVAMVPLIGYTLWWAWMTSRDFGPLSEFLALSSICEVERGEGAEQVVGVAAEGQVTRSQSNLNHRRYAVNDETLYVAPSDKRTDYSQPPMSSFYYGVLNTGRRRYAHPALSGSLPFPWLPAKATARRFGDGAAERRGVVLSLRRKMAKKLKRSQDNSAEGEEPRRSASSPMPDGWMTGDSYRDGASGASGASGGGLGVPEAEGGSSGERMSASQLSTSSNPWGDPTPSQARMGMGMNRKTSYDPVSGIIALPEDNVWGDEGSSEDEERDHGPASPSTYFHHPERRRTVSGSNNSQGDGTDRQSSGRT